MSRYYDTDPDDPEAPKVLDEYNGLRPGMHVVYQNPAFRQEDGTYRTGGMDPPLIIEEIVLFETDGFERGFFVEAILGDNDGEGIWQCNADNLAPDPDR